MEGLKKVDKMTSIDFNASYRKAHPESEVCSCVKYIKKSMRVIAEIDMNSETLIRVIVFRNFNSKEEDTSKDDYYINQSILPDVSPGTKL